MRLFITGTDTNVGKTYISVALLAAFNQLGLTTLGVKPVASGCERIGNKWINEDALALQNASSIQLDYDAINPFAYGPAIAPHLAAAEAQSILNRSTLMQGLAPALNQPADICLIEGAGGWSLPLNAEETLADVVIEQQWPVILVVGLRLGCLNHAILSTKVMLQDKARLLGWIGNGIDATMAYQAENIATLQQWLPVPCLGVVKRDERLGETTTLPLLQLLAGEGEDC